jgi:hypothetical protein
MHDSGATAELLAALDAHPIGHLTVLLRAERNLARARVASDTEAQPLFADAVAGLRRFASPYHLAGGLLDHAAFLVGTGDASSAEPLIDEAVAIAERLGAQPVLRRAEHIQRSRRADRVL